MGRTTRRPCSFSCSYALIFKSCRFTNQQQAARLFVLVSISKTRGPTRFHGHTLTGIGKQWFADLVQAHLRTLHIRGTMIHLKHVFHRRDRLHIRFRWKTPLFSQPGVEFIVLQAVRMVSETVWKVRLDPLREVPDRIGLTLLSALVKQFHTTLRTASHIPLSARLPVLSRPFETSCAAGTTPDNGRDRWRTATLNAIERLSAAPSGTIAEFANGPSWG